MELNWKVNIQLLCYVFAKKDFKLLRHFVPNKQERDKY